MDLTITGKGVEINSAYNSISVTISGTDIDDILGNITIKEAIAFYGISNILAEIGSDECKEQFDLIENNIESHRNLIIDHILDK